MASWTRLAHGRCCPGAGVAPVTRRTPHRPRSGDAPHMGSGQSLAACKNADRSEGGGKELMGERRSILAAVLAAAVVAPSAVAVGNDRLETMEALKGKDYGKPRMRYPDFEMSSTGLQYKDLVEGKGPKPSEGDTVLIDWDGYTIGYYGRPFEARNKAKGGSFVGEDKDFLKVRLGAHEVIPGVEEAIAGMRVGGVRRVIVPVELGYPDNDFSKKGPKPQTFSGQRALDFVLKNQGLIDKTLLFDIEVIRIVG